MALKRSSKKQAAASSSLSAAGVGALNSTLDKLVAYVSLKSKGGVSLLAGNAKISHESIEEYTSTPEDYRIGVGKLQDFGFEVEYAADLWVRVSGTAKLFNAKMGLRFEKRNSEMYLPTQQTAANCLDMNSEYLEGMAFPQPIELHGRKATRKQPPAPKKAAPKKSAAKRRSMTASAAGSTTPSATPPTLTPNYHHLNVPGDIVNALNAGPVHAAGNKGQGVRAAMIDSGFGWDHPYFQGKGYNLAVELPAGNLTDTSGHGTGESANFLAIAPKAQLYGLSMDDTLRAFQHARDVLGVKIISNSWGSRLPTDGQFGTWDPYWSLILGEIALCAAAGMIVLFSGGNGGLSATASTPDVISVGGVYLDEFGTLNASDYASSFDSHRFPGQHVPFVCGLCGMRPKACYIMLPIPKGCDIDRSLGGIAFPNGDGTGKTDGWGVFSGTSAACPMVAGVVALILQAHPTADLAEVRQRLSKAKDVVAGASSMGDPAGPGFDAATGHGLVDADLAVQ